MEEKDAGLRDRAAGVLVGLAVGDALGAPYEFDIPGPSDPEMRGGGIGPWEPGEWTDDTQMALCIAQSAATGVLDATDVGARFLAWFASGPKDVGHQTRLVLEAARAPDELPDVAAELHALRPGSTAGNGSLMRTAPVALAHLGDDAAIVEQARAISSLTHADPVCGDACVLWCIALDRALRDARLDGITDGLALLPSAARAQWAAWLHEARSKPPEHFVPNGYVVSALQTAVSAIEAGHAQAGAPREHVVRSLVAAIHAGHDTDTTAAIAGSLLGARYGASVFPPEWTAPLHGWPGLTGDDLIELALQILDSR